MLSSDWTPTPEEIMRLTMVVGLVVAVAWSAADRLILGRRRRP